MTRWHLLLLLPLLAACSSRAPARVGGDATGVPVTIAVRYDDHAAALLTQNAGFTRTVVVERSAWPDPYLYGSYWNHPYRHRHPGFVGAHAMWGPDYAYEPSTTLHLLLGRGPAEGQYLRLELDEATWNGTITIAPGTTVVASLQGTGGRSGWRELGRFTATAGQSVTISLEGAEPRVETQTPPQ